MHSFSLIRDCCCSVTKLCLITCKHIDYSSMPGFSVLHYLLQFAQTHVHWAGDAIQPSQPLSPFSSCPQSFPASGSFPVSWLFTLGGQSIRASASVHSMSIHRWFPLGLAGLIFLLSKWLSRVFSRTTIQKHQFFGTQPSLWSNSHIIHDYWKNHSFRENPIKNLDLTQKDKCMIPQSACMHAKLLWLCPTLCDPMDCSLPGSSVHGILWAKILEWVAMSSSRGSSQPKDWTHVFYVSCIKISW